jgi:hypothetical protein
VLFEYDTHIEYSQSRIEQLRRDWPTTSAPARYALGEWLVRLGRRLAPEPRPASAFPHEALPRC